MQFCTLLRSAPVRRGAEKVRSGGERGEGAVEWGGGEKEEERCLSGQRAEQTRTRLEIKKRKVKSLHKINKCRPFLNPDVIPTLFFENKCMR